MTTLVLIRHGRSVANADSVLAGRTDGVGLDEVGREQANRLGELLRGVDFRVVYRSPILRCEQTATMAGWPDALVDDGLNECDYGDWTNRRLEELAREPLWPEIQQRPSGVRFPGGESMLEMRDRAVGAVQTIAARHNDHDVVALVSHGDVIKAILSHALGQDFDDFQRIVVAPASVSIVDIRREGSPTVWCLNANTDPSVMLARRPAPTVGGGDTAGGAA